MCLSYNTMQGKMLLRVSPIFPILLILSGGVAGAPATVPAKEAATATPAAGLGYAIGHPAGWSVREGAVPGVDLAMTCDADPGANITVTRAPAEGAGGFTEAQAREVKEMYSKNIPGYAVTAEEWRTVGGARAFRLCGRYALGSGGLRMEMQNAQVMFVAEGTLFTVTYTSTPALFMKHLGDFETALDGFSPRAASQPATRTAAPSPRAS